MRSEHVPIDATVAHVESLGEQSGSGNARMPLNLSTAATRLLVLAAVLIVLFVFALVAIELYGFALLALDALRS